METKSGLADYFANLIKSDEEIRKKFLSEFTMENLQKLDLFKTHRKLYDRLRLVTEAENLYEADQLFKTIHFRCLNNNSIEDALTLLFNGVIFFTDKNSLQCAYDLTKAFIETLKKSSRKNLDPVLRAQIKFLHQSLGKCSSTDEERSEFSIAVLKWSSNFFKKGKIDIKNEDSIAQNYQNVFGHHDIHRDFALNYWIEKNYIQARYHFLHSLDSHSFAYMLIELHLNFGYPSEYDLFLAQALFQYLTLRNLKSAEQLFLTYCQNHPMVKKSKINNQFYESATINFLFFLITTLKESNFNEYQQIVRFYKSWLNRDTSFSMYLERVEEYFFNIKPDKRESGGLFSNLMRMFTGDSQGSRPMTSQEADSDREDFYSVADIEDNDNLD